MSTYVHPPRVDIVDAVRRALTEDLTPLGDLSASIVPDGVTVEAVLVARESGVLSGTACAVETFAAVDPDVVLDWRVDEGAPITAGEIIAVARGPLGSILIAERPALNFLMYLSGIASNTRRYVEAASGPAGVWDTRKTTPGLRSLEKAAVRAGGARNHRGNLSDWVMLKDNHLRGVSIAEGVARARDLWPGRTIQVEADRLEQVESAVAAGADAILLDNMTPVELGEAVDRVQALCGDGRRPLLEASGGIDIDTIAEVSHTGVDMISTSKLCFGAPTLDIGLDIAIPGEGDER